MNFLRVALPIALCLPMGLAFAAPASKDAPKDVQSMMVQRCVAEATAAKVTDAQSAQKVCSCTIDIQAKNLKLGEFWDIQTAAYKGQDPRTIPALARIQPQLDKCRAGVTLKMPTAQTAPAKK
jgi:hypothetical protein